MKTVYDVVKKLLRTEKGLTMTETQNKYLFEVDHGSNKQEIKQAIEKIYSVKVRKVNTLIQPRKPKVLRREAGFLPERKKAIVQLAEGHKIDLTV
jgi:large subunit ribosomal protein L23